MPRALALLLILAPAGLGCSVLRYAHLVCIQEPELFCDPKDDRASLATYRALADEAWAAHGAACPEDCLYGDYSWGFREGFAQYVYAGGTGEPPATPPRPYWQLDLRSPEGAAAIRSWFQGYRLGSGIARDGGYRKAATITVSASLADRNACDSPGEAEPGCLVDHSPSAPAFPGPTPELIVPGDPATAPPMIESLPDAAKDNDDRFQRLPPPNAEAVEVAPPEFEARAISASGETTAPQHAIFQIVR